MRIRGDRGERNDRNDRGGGGGGGDRRDRDDRRGGGGGGGGGDRRDRGDGGSRDAREAADSAALSRLLQRADESIVVPQDLWERITEPTAATEIRPGVAAADSADLTVRRSIIWRLFSRRPSGG
jgi:hypothetical protein